MSSNFTSEFVAIFGKRHTSFPYYPDMLEAKYMFKALVESECTKRGPEKLPWFPKNCNMNIEQNFFFSHPQQLGYKSYIELYAKVKNYSIDNAINELVEQYSLNSLLHFWGLSPQYIDKKSCERLNYDLVNWNSWHTNDHLFNLPDSITAGEQNLLSKSIIRFIDQSIAYGTTEIERGYCGYVKYKNIDNKPILLPMITKRKNTVAFNYQPERSVEYFLSPGVPNTCSQQNGYTWPLLGRNLLEYRPKIVFLCEDLLLAEYLNNMVSDSNRYTKKDFVAVAPYASGKFLENVDFSNLLGMNVIYIPAINRDSYLNVDKYEKKCTKVYINSFKIYHNALVWDGYAAKPDDFGSLADPFERFLGEKSVNLFGRESGVLGEIVESSLSSAQYQRFCFKVGLHETKPEPMSSSSPSVAEILHREINPSQEVYTDCFSGANSLGLIVANQNSGKSYLAVSLAMARSCGIDFLSFKRLEKTKVLYLAAEDSQDVFASIVQRANKALKCSSADLEEYFKFELFRETNLNCILDLCKEETQLHVKKCISKHEPKLIIFDNLISFCPGFRQKGGSAWKDVFSFVKQIEKEHGCAVLLVHHSNKDDEAAGSRDIEAQCQNVVTIQKHNFDKNTNTSAVNENAANNGGLNIQLKFTKCKAYPQLENKPYNLTLNNLNTCPDANPNWLIHDADTNNIYSTEQPEFEPFDNTDNLGEIINYASSRGVFAREDIEKKLGYRKSAVNNMLKVLVENKKINKIGEGKSTRYSLRV
ncbi:AAA family ATPase [Desulfovibrio litoralis]|uniref:AAA domain-containing protein n=1 Tax=Desulfovibrio litoralis DSM 11393 TaxID=1121455 RepID=A0A1M7TQ12_9BACT|nr:AAA family ATPase [Desulfovibrio litoralis]SHN72766.1 AAA domain-containing protein [Desulfovibrio litoralis DSM 11393]